MLSPKWLPEEWSMWYIRSRRIHGNWWGHYSWFMLWYAYHNNNNVLFLIHPCQWKWLLIINHGCNEKELEWIVTFGRKVEKECRRALRAKEFLELGGVVQMMQGLQKRCWGCSWLFWVRYVFIVIRITFMYIFIMTMYFSHSINIIYW